ncbi:unnamed protein product [Musa acuminata subsp. malaccensis]|uniref:(wild Malaysian banana) hypothetical protein n=1 Tax=Musa acuminata subsp. malaccensis TaxID=214687 RepID=A0A8D6ZMK8_MUSAM|nr:unnamed protein product [Musa acuminata subsp. malaccensis]
MNGRKFQHVIVTNFHKLTCIQQVHISLAAMLKKLSVV